MGSKKTYQPLTAKELSEQTGMPLIQVEELMTKTFTLEEISQMTSIPIKIIERRAREENWPVKEEPAGGDKK